MMVNWDDYGLPQIWEMVKNESAGVGAKQAQAWENTAQLCDEQASQLDQAAAQLAETWTPAPGTAASAFQDLIRMFTMSMHASAGAARTNSVVIADITYQMVAARNKIADLVGQGNRYRSAEASQIPAVPKLGEPHPLPPPTDVARPPGDWQRMLDRHARDIMIHTETAVIQQAARIERPPIYTAPESKFIDGQAPGGVGGGSASSTGSGGISGSGGLSHEMPVLRPLPVPRMSRPLDSTELDVDPGTVLASTAGLPIGPSELGARAGSPVIGPSLGLVQTPAGVTLPPGGVIGVARPAAELPVGARTTIPAQSQGLNSSGASRVSGGTPVAPFVPPVGGGRPTPATGAGAARSSGGGRRGRSNDKDDPWAVAEGGPAVLEPRAEPIEHDPGPGVIGLDR